MLGVKKMTHNQIYYISDVHFEFIISSKGICQEKLEQYRKFFTPQPHQVQPNHKQILVIAGDLITSRHFHYIADFMTSLPYDNILYVLGNHEYYGDDFQKAQARIQDVIDKNEILKDKMVILENDFVQFNGLKIIGTSYWLIGNIHGHSHFSEPHSYHNEYGIPVYTNTLGYIDNEFDLNKYRELPFICT